MDGPCPTTRPRTCPRCCAPTRHPSTRSTIWPIDSARRVRGDTAGVTLTGLTLATADLRPGDVFVAVRGVNRHGAEFATAAAEKGAVAIVTDAAGADRSAASGLPVVVVDDPRGILGDLSAWVYGTGRDDHLPILFAPTGTNGKTSVAHLLEGILGQLGVVTGLSSTAERHIAGAGDRLPAHHARGVRDARPAGAACASAASRRSPSRSARRRSAAAGSTGSSSTSPGSPTSSHDHLDDYADMREYFEAKLPLFRARPCAPRGGLPRLRPPAPRSSLAAKCRPSRSALRPSRRIRTAAGAADWVVEILDERPDGTEFRLVARDGRTLTTVVPVIGRHMAANAGLAIVMILEAGYAWERLVAALDGAAHRRLPARSHRARLGRREVPRSTSTSATPPTRSRRRSPRSAASRPASVLMLFGADGDRDATKRHDMGRAGAQGSDILVITDHHPRFEDPDSIRATLLEGAQTSTSRMPTSTSTHRPSGRSSRRSRSSATAMRSSGPVPVTRTTATSAACARRTRRASSRAAR